MKLARHQLSKAYKMQKKCCWGCWPLLSPSRSHAAAMQLPRLCSHQAVGRALLGSRKGDFNRILKLREVKAPVVVVLVVVVRLKPATITLTLARY